MNCPQRRATHAASSVLLITVLSVREVSQPANPNTASAAVSLSVLSIVVAFYKAEQGTVATAGAAESYVLM